MAKMDINRFVAISGCSSGGKSTLLAELGRRGHATVEEPGRRIVKQELAGEGSALPCIAVQAHPLKPPGPGRHRAATTLAIRMDQAAAIELLAKLRVFARKMDWPLPREHENQA
jgi:hypothetical protein